MGSVSTYRSGEADAGSVVRETAPNKLNGSGNSKPRFSSSVSKKRKRKRRILIKRRLTNKATGREVRKRIPDETLKGDVAASILAALTFDKKLAKRIATKIRPRHFDNEFERAVFDRALRFYREFGKPAGDYIADLFEKELKSSNKSRVRIYTDLLHDIKDLSETLNRKFVLSQLNKFVAYQVLRHSITVAAERLGAGDLDAARDELKFGIKAADSGQQGLLNRIRELGDFRDLSFAPVEDALGPAFQWPAIVQISGSRGDGKTWLALYVGLALACGIDLFGWACNRRYKVLFIDGELPPWTLQERIEAVCEDLGSKPKSGWFNVYSTNESDSGIRLNLTDRKQVDEIVEVCSRFDVVIFDNIFSLSSGGDKNAAETFEPLNEISIRLRGLNTLVIRVAHLGKDKSKGAFGSSVQEAPLDVALELKRTSSDTFHCNDVIRVTCTKSRNYPLGEIRPIDLEFCTNRKGRFHIEHSSAATGKAKSMVPDIVDLMQAGKWKGIRKKSFGDKYGASRFTVRRAAKYAEQSLQGEGLFND